MRERMKNFLLKHGAMLCSAAIVITSVAVNSCRMFWYEPEEPEGLRELLDKSEE